jgi:hypothetical protein
MCVARPCAVCKRGYDAAEDVGLVLINAASISLSRASSSGSGFDSEPFRLMHSWFPPLQTTQGWGTLGQFKLRDYQRWLLRQRDGFLDFSPEESRELFPPEVSTFPREALCLSYQKIGDLLFPEIDDPGTRKKRAADACNRVESEFGRGSLKRHKKQSET